MKFKDFLKESKVSYKVIPSIKFRVKAEEFNDVKKHPEVKKRMGPNTVVIDVTDEAEIAKAPGDNKWNAMKRLYGNDSDEILCAKAFKGEWVCLAINVHV